MPFNSILFFIFLGFVTAIHFFLKQNQRKYFLIFVSFTFICFKNVESLLLLITAISLTYFLARKISTTLDLFYRKLLLRIGIFFNLSFLFYFKYFETTEGGNFKPETIIFLLGISFYTLQNISYLLEIYSKRIKEIPSFLDYTLYSSFFPKFIMGPITLPQDFIPQISRSKILYTQIISGFNRILLGVVKKVVIADRLAAYVHYNFDLSDSTTGLTTLITTYLFTLQLYFDFSGYSDIALGSAKMLGFDLKENFNLPLRAKSISEFWRKWHISLTSWITNYVFYPVSFHYRKYKKFGVAIALIITFLLSGIWHGIGFTFLFYALSHAVYMCIEIFTKSTREKIATFFHPKIYRFISVFITFNLVSLSFVFFRATTLEKAWQMITSIFNYTHFIPRNWSLDLFSKLAITGDQESFFNLFISLILGGGFLFFEKQIVRTSISEKLKFTSLLIFVLLLLLFGVFTSQEQFIYNQF